MFVTVESGFERTEFKKPHTMHMDATRLSAQMRAHTIDSSLIYSAPRSTKSIIFFRNQAAARIQAIFAKRCWKFGMWTIVIQWGSHVLI